VDHITTNIRGANYFSVKSTKSFKKQLDDDFDYCVTPLVFDVKIQVMSDQYEIEKVYGSPEANQATGDLMKIATLFPSAKEKDGQTKGGVVLIKMKKKSNTGESLKLRITYEDWFGKKCIDDQVVQLKGEQANYYQDTGVRKAIVLTQFANLIRNYLAGIEIDSSAGITDPPELKTRELKWSEKWKDSFTRFKTYFESEIDSLNDESLDKEVKTLETILEKDKKKEVENQTNTAPGLPQLM